MNIKRILLSAVLSAGVMISSVGCSLFGGGSSASSGNIGDITFADGDKIAVIEFKDYGTVKAKLFPDIAPVGVENFIKLAEQGYYDGLKIHRVIQDTYIQGGSLNGDGTVSEKARNFYGALGYAADAYGNNSVQFYIVSNKTPADTSKISAEKVQAKADELASKLANESVAESTPEGTAETAEAAETDNSDTKLLTYQQTYYSNNASFIKKNGADAAEKYKKVGGLYQIDGGYTVFGQVYEGFDVIDKINAVDVTTNASGEKSMPIQDVIISSVSIETYKASTAEATAEASKADSKKNSAAPASSSPTVSTAEVSAAATSETVSTAQTVSTADAQQTAQASQATSEQTSATSSSTAEISTVDTKEAA